MFAFGNNTQQAQQNNPASTSTNAFGGNNAQPNTNAFGSSTNINTFGAFGANNNNNATPNQPTNNFFGASKPTISTGLNTSHAPFGSTSTNTAPSLNFGGNINNNNTAYGSNNAPFGGTSGTTQVPSFGTFGTASATQNQNSLNTQANPLQPIQHNIPRNTKYSELPLASQQELDRIQQFILEKTKNKHNIQDSYMNLIKHTEELSSITKSCQAKTISDEALIKKLRKEMHTTNRLNELCQNIMSGRGSHSDDELLMYFRQQVPIFEQTLHGLQTAIDELNYYLKQPHKSLSYSANQLFDVVRAQQQVFQNLSTRVENVHSSLEHYQKPR